MNKDEEQELLVQSMMNLHLLPEIYSELIMTRKAILQINDAIQPQNKPVKKYVLQGDDPISNKYVLQCDDPASNIDSGIIDTLIKGT